MSKQSKDTVLTGEIYFDYVELDDATNDAIGMLAGIHPDEYGEDELEPDEEADGRMVFLVNTVQLFHGVKFDETRRTSFADLMSIGEYLMDAANLATGTDTPSAPARVMAAIAASLYTDAAGQPGDTQANFEEAMAKVNADAKTLLDLCLNPSRYA